MIKRTPHTEVRYPSYEYITHHNICVQQFQCCVVTFNLFTDTRKEVDTARTTIAIFMIGHDRAHF